jgi:hypothetical protein
MSAPQKFRKKPVEIEAMQWHGTAAGATPIIDWVLSNGGTARYHCTHDMGCDDGPAGHTLAIDTLEGTMQSRAGDWIIRGVQGEFYPCKPDIFEQTYEPAGKPLSAVLGLEVRVIAEGDEHDGPILGSVTLIAPREKADAVAAAVRSALRTSS